MINVVVETEVEVSKSQYPVLMKRKKNGLIVLFYRDSYGIVISLGETFTNWRLGETCTSWNMNDFEKFDGVVKLSNA